MGLTSTAFQQAKGKGMVWSMELSITRSFDSKQIAEYARFSQATAKLSNLHQIGMVWNSSTGVWEWEIEGWNWPWEDESETTDNPGANYGTGVNRDAGVDGGNHPCLHEWVNISFSHLHLACRLCGVDKPE